MGVTKNKLKSRKMIKINPILLVATVKKKVPLQATTKIFQGKNLLTVLVISLLIAIPKIKAIAARFKTCSMSHTFTTSFFLVQSQIFKLL